MIPVIQKLKQFFLKEKTLPAKQSLKPVQLMSFVIQLMSFENKERKQMFYKNLKEKLEQKISENKKQTLVLKDEEPETEHFSENKEQIFTMKNEQEKPETEESSSDIELKPNHSFN